MDISMDTTASTSEVRLDGNRGDKESTSKKRMVSRKKQTSAGVWPCQIGGCDKQFAREADLKRHQRTTKSHSMPSFSCPQCDANFTRTDALRRHQKSRHDGVVVDGNSSGRSGDENIDYNLDLSQKGKDRGGPSSYYRSHTATTTSHITQQYANSLGIPDPSVRTWASAYPYWPPEGSVPYTLPPTVYYPSPHYRPHTSNYHADRSPSHTQSTSSGLSQSPTPARTSRNSSIQPSAPPHGSGNGTSRVNLNLEDTELTAAEVVAALQSVLGMRTEARNPMGDIMHHERAHENHGHLKMPTERDVDSGLSDDDLQQIGLDELHKFASFVRSESMEHILTEDGETMLNPGILSSLRKVIILPTDGLQESLAESPPPL